MTEVNINELCIKRKTGLWEVIFLNEEKNSFQSAIEFNKQNETAVIQTSTPSKIENPDEDEKTELHSEVSSFLSHHACCQYFYIKQKNEVDQDIALTDGRLNIGAKVSSFLSHMFCCQFVCRDKS